MNLYENNALYLVLCCFLFCLCSIINIYHLYYPNKMFRLHSVGTHLVSGKIIYILGYSAGIYIIHYAYKCTYFYLK